MFYQAITTGVSCAIIAVTMIVLLPNEAILNWWFRFGYWAGIKLINGNEAERWFYRPIWGCQKCFAGQLALWTYLICHLRSGMAQIWQIDGVPVSLPCLYDYSPFYHTVAICTAIIASVLLTHLIKKTENEN